MGRSSLEWPVIIFRFPGMTGEEFSVDAGMVEQDPGTLKQVMEANRE